MTRKLNHIELFAGCGGLNLGLKAAGFELLLANELSSMAAETFAFNFLAEDLEQLADDEAAPNKVLWLSSKHPWPSLKERLRENPLEERPPGEFRHCDLPNNAQDLKGKLIVGSIVDLNKWLDDNPYAEAELREGLGDGRVDLISGGPPCQSFSMAGMRDFSNARNRLPGVFAEFVGKVRPKFVLLENVSGILRPFAVSNNKEKVYAWVEVAKAFALQGYMPLCLHTNAKFAGVAQNRPRFVMIAVRHEEKYGCDDVFSKIKPRLEKSEPGLFTQSEVFYQKVRANQSVSETDLICFEVDSQQHAPFFAPGRLLSPLFSHRSREEFAKVIDAIDDLKYEARGVQTKYAELLSEIFGDELDPAHHNDELQNLKAPKNTEKTQRRFRIYQVLQEIATPAVQKEVRGFLNGTHAELGGQTVEVLLKQIFLMPNGERDVFRGKTRQEKVNKLVNFLLEHKTRKHSQKALAPEAPAPATLSIPDDACHYEPLRTLSIREMARIQSFPDEFVFCSKATTGGQMRKFQVPQYTQVGNAVPPLLGLALGKVIGRLNSYYQEASAELAESSPATIKARIVAEAL
jgi:DNA (cytosine-5)-methyltransferase 1